MTTGYAEEQKKAVACGHWPLYRFRPASEKRQGKNPSATRLEDAHVGFRGIRLWRRTAIGTLKQSKPEAAAELMKLGQSRDAV